MLGVLPFDPAQGRLAQDDRRYDDFVSRLVTR